MPVDFRKIGLFVMQGDRILLCRKRGLAALILPGGTLEPGESALACLTRELREELGDVVLEDPSPVGTYTDVAASDPGKIVEIQLYQGTLKGTPVASSEIEEIVWFGPGSDWDELSPILIRQMFPDLIRRGFLPWSTCRNE